MSQFYRNAGRVLRDFDRKKGSLKSLVFTSQSVDLKMKKKLYAILCRTIKYKDVIDEVIRACKLMESEPSLTGLYHVCLVLVCDALYGRGVKCGGVLKYAILRHIDELKHAKERVRLSLVSVLATPILPKYVRINSLKGSNQDILSKIEEEGYTRKKYDDICNCDCLTQSQKNEGKIKMKNCYCEDSTVPGLLMFCCCTPLVECRLYIESQIIIQDKASCLPALILAPKDGSHVIDACAAPGNKTTQLASIMHNSGLIHAFDKDPKRCATLKDMVVRAGATNVDVQLLDFLKVDPKQYSNVNYILVDPSCSGSGLYGRLNYDMKKSKDIKRLAQLSKFQCRILNHALSFPAVQRVVYSTCSLYKDENEYVIRNVLLSNASKFELVHVLPTWPSRGLPVFTKAECCIRTSSDDRTNGFFVAMFQRCSSKLTQ